MDKNTGGGAKRISFEEVVGRAGPKLHPLVADLAKSMRSCKAVSTAKAYEAASKGRRDWCKAQGLVDDEISFILFLADRAKSVGSSAIGVEKAAFHFSNGPLSHYIGNFAGEMMEAKRRAEIANRSDTTVVLRGDIENVWELWNPSIEARLERDILIVVLSFEALLRASEAAELLWSDLEQAGPLLRVSIRKAKNDQMALGRTTFVECREGSKLHLLVNRWKARVSNTSQFVFANLANGKQLTPSAVASSAKKLLTKVGRGDSSHHSLRRGRANELLSKGMSRDQVQQRGRWRSFAGLARYIKDTPGAQGIVEM